MVEVLAQIQARVQDDNVYQGDKDARQHREKAARLTNESPLDVRIETMVGLARAELVIGNEEAAIAELTEAYQRVPKELTEGWLQQKREDILLDLGVAYLRLSETENCCAQDSPENYILPITGGGLHAEPRGARGAIRYLQELYQVTHERTTKHLEAQWLLNIAHMALGEYPDSVPETYRLPQEAFQSKVAFPRFVNVAAGAGLDTFSLAGGVVCDDLDNNGYLDLMVSTWDASGQIRYFQNNGDGTFSDRTLTSGLGGILGGLNLVQADYNNDGNVDILVLRGGWLYDKGREPNSLLRNNGDGSFTDVTFDAGLGEVHYPTQTASWADYDLDGDLDLYIGNESFPELPAPSQLFRNNGDGTFSDVAQSADVENLRFAKAVCWGDFDGDRYPDLYISNMSGLNRLYKNNRDGTFTDVAESLGVTEPLESFPTWFFDVNNDGHLDLFVSAYSAQISHLTAYALGQYVRSSHKPKLYLNRGDGRFEDVGRSYGLDQPSLPMGANFGDLDHDGYVDFYLGTGDPDFKNIMPNIMYWNNAGRRFVDVTMAGGFGHLQKGHGVAFADLDHDGDQDVFVELGGAFLGDKFKDALFENPGFGNHWITIQLVGTHSNRSAIGSRIRVEIEEDGKIRSVYKWVNSGGTFGANPLRQQIGLGQAQAIRRVEIFWPRTGITQRLEQVPLDSLIRVTEGSSRWQRGLLKSFPLPRKPEVH